MGTIDMSQVAGFKAVDAEGNELGVVSMNELTESISKQVLQTIAMRNQATTLEQPALMSAASTLAAGNDAYENELPEQTDLKWARALDASGNPILISKESLASVVGGLLETKEFAISIGGMWNFGKSEDLNLLLSTGIYTSNENTKNRPTNDTCLVVAYGDGTYCIQKVYALNSDEVYQRRILIYLDKYFPWVKIN